MWVIYVAKDHDILRWWSTFFDLGMDLTLKPIIVFSIMEVNTMEIE